tara:strand:- start:4691 stop:4876 length:186 start_codon:yes stop_codon:yes gene_type:complete
MNEENKDRLSQSRLKGEDFEDYKLRRKLAKSAIKEYLRGRLVWKSFSFGTFVKNKNIEAEV